MNPPSGKVALHFSHCEEIMILFLKILLNAWAIAGGFNFYTQTGEGNAGHMVVLAGFDLNSAYCLLDTGARISVVDASEGIFQSFPSQGPSETGGIGGGKVKGDFILVRRLLLGLDSWLYENKKIVRQTPAPATCLIGNDVFRDRAYSIDFDKKRIESHEGLSEGARLVSLQNLWTGMEVKFSGVSQMAIWDTGAARTVVDLKIVEENPENFEFIRDFEARDSTETPIAAKLYRIKRLELMGHEFEDIQAIVTDLSAMTKQVPGVRMLLGFNAISRFNWIMDPPKSRAVAIRRDFLPLAP